MVIAGSNSIEKSGMDTGARTPVTEVPVWSLDCTVAEAQASATQPAVRLVQHRENLKGS